ncbi:MAG: glycosyltransferase [Bacteroidaceae bacterium]|nr:glycosyltransferase [Bacteroidaceae bacterium]
MCHNPLVSILVPVYNVEAYLPQCFDSLLGQTYSHLQIVLIDDGSSDGSWRVMQEYAARDERIEIYHQENQGVGATRNHLLEKIKGDYVLFVDSDDWVELDMVEFLLGKASKDNADVVTCGNVINEAPVAAQYSQKVLSRNEAIERFLYHIEFRGSLCNKLVRTSLLHNCRFHCGISLGEDALFCWHFLQHANKVLFTDRQLYHYRMNESSICHSTFGPKKLSAHYAWEQMCDETAKWWPQYLPIAQARHCIEDVLLLRDAVKSNYPVKSDIKLLQTTIANYSHHLFKLSITSFKMKVFAVVISKCSTFAKYF